MKYIKKMVRSRSRVESLKDIRMAPDLLSPHLLSKKIKHHEVVVEKSQSL